MRTLLVVLCAVLLSSCGSGKVVSQRDITQSTQWLDSSEDNPIINVVQRVYSNDDVEIVIKKKLTTDYVKLRLSGAGRIISKTTIKNK